MSTITAARDWRVHQRVTLPRVVRAEWIKFWSLRSTWITLAAAVVVVIGIGLLASSLRGDSSQSPGPGPDGLGTDSTAVSLAGTTFAQLILGTLGVLFTATEYSTGMIRSTLAAVPRRLPMLWAKILVFATVALALSLAASFAAFAAGQAVIGTDSSSLSDPGVLRAVVGTAVYLTGAGLLGLALGAVLRSTAAAVTTVLGVLFVLPGISGLLLPDSWSDNVTPYLPSNAGGAFTAVTQAADQLSPWAGLAVFAGYVIVTVVAAAGRLKIQDA
jgi:hypothetical protein